MKKLILSISIGGFAGVALGGIFIIVSNNLPDIFQKVFFNTSQAPVAVVSAIQQKFMPASNQYIVPAIDSVIPQEGKVAYADLGSMNITLFEDGQKVGEYPIKSIGREGTAWQTPLGQFDMSYKKENHFSSIGHVYMPWSMHFFGNYFIHGWPYYPDGTPVSEGYSGGCIRMETQHAKSLYDFVDKNTQLIVTTTSNQLEKQNELTYEVAQPVPSLESNFIVADLETGEVVGAKNQTDQVQISSLTKIMTALISLEVLNQYNQTVFKQNLVTIGDILYALLLTDNDRAGEILAEHKNKNQYLLDMNTRASSLGMNSTLYTDVNGDKETTLSTLEDTLRLMQYIKWYKPFLIQVLSLSEYEKSNLSLDAIHPLKDGAEYIGGFSNIEQTEMITLVSLNLLSDKSETPIKKTFIIIVQNSEDTMADTIKLNSWLTQHIKIRTK